MCHLTLMLFGPVSATQNQEAVRFWSVKGQALLIYLAVEQESPQRRVKLIDLLWPDFTEKSGRTNLRQALSQLRKLAPAGADDDVPLLQTRGQIVALHPDFDLCCDAIDFEASLAAARALQERPDWQSNAAFRQHLEEAVALFRGPFLSDFYLDDNNVFEAWAQQKRERYRRQALDALGTLAGLHLDAGSLAPAQQYAQRQLEIEPLHEPACRQLMEALARSGQPAEALARYELLGRLLREEWGMAPAQKTSDLAERIRAGDLTLHSDDAIAVRGYELGAQIGAGAFGAIFQARQTGVGRDVAVKVIKAGACRQAGVHSPF